jgi:hypothetical protein
MARATIAAWLKNREAQLQLLRGVSRENETVYDFDKDTCALTSVTMTISAFPPMVICHQLQNEWWMWSLRVGDPQYEQQSPDAPVNANPAAATANAAAGKSFPWNFAPSAVAEAFFTACGAHVGSAPETWKTQLAQKGFVFPAGRPGDFLYSVGASDRAGWTWLIFGEGLPRTRDSVWDAGNGYYEFRDRYGDGHSPSAGVPVCFKLSPDQTAHYWYD